jgi:hypothetical protein
VKQRLRQLFLRLWSSPTFTGWGNKLVQSLRLLVLLPLLLNRFSEAEAAAWLMFSTLLFFGSMIDMQVSSLMSRMTAVAYGGGQSLAPVDKVKREKTSLPPNWPLIQRLYETCKPLNLAIAFIGTSITAVLGYFSLGPITESIEAAEAREAVWLAFIAFLVGQFIKEAFRHYPVMMRGLNQVALTNRWEMLFMLISTGSGVLALLLGAGIFELAVIMQIFLVIGALRMYLLLHFVVEPRFRTYKRWHLDHEVAKWAWPPLWKGVVQMVANRGGARVGAVFLARHADTTLLASMLLSFRLLETLETFAWTPFKSHVPRFGKLLGAGNQEALRAGVVRSQRFTHMIFVLGVLAIGFIAPVLLGLAGSNVAFLPASLFFCLAIGFYMISTTRLLVSISLVGNHVVGVRGFVIAALVTAVLAYLLIPKSPFAGYLVAVYLPVPLVLNALPLRRACTLLSISHSEFLKTVVLAPAFLLLLGSALAILWS